MYDPKFEKAIQQKMEELEFHPPEAVWVNIEKAVVVKRRRRTGLVWRYLLPAAFVAAAVGIYGHYAGGKATIAEKTAGTMQKAGTAAVATPNGNATSASLTPGSSANRSVINGRSLNGSGSSRTLAAHGQTTHVAASRRITAPGGATATNHGDGTSYSDPTATGDGTQPTGYLATTGHSATTGQGATAGQTGQTGQGATAGQTGQKGPAAWLYLPDLADQRLTPRVQGSALNTKKSKGVTMAGLSHPQRHWEAGFVAGGGWSRLNRLNSDQAKAALSANAASLYTINGSSSSKHYISDVRPGASFDGGIYLQRALSDRWIVNTGMNLHYYSNHISVGQQLTTYVQASASYFIPTVAAMAQNSSMYTAGNTRSFTNKYYFLELPAGLQWKVNKSHLLPIVLEGGVSLSRLMGASALFYDAKTGLYSKDGDIVNKTQLNVSSALLVGLPFHGVSIQVGPQIQYGLTPMVNTQGLGDQHFLYTGIRLVVIPGRK